MAEYIEKQAAIDAINSHFGFNIEEKYGCAVQEVINGLPTADVVKVRHAKDVYNQYTEQHCEFMCSICGGWIGVIEGGLCDFNYCPNCGAKMEGETE